MDTINRLLKKQAPKRRGRAQIEADRLAEGLEEDSDGPKASSVYVKYIQNVDGCKLAIPEEWLRAPYNMFGSTTVPAGGSKPYSRRMVEEME
jgi:Ino eighty subunit 2